MSFVGADLTIELPDDIEEEDGAEELESRDLHEVYDPEGKYDTEDRCPEDSPEDGFFLEFWWEIFCCHTDEDSIIPAHHDIDENDIEKSKCACRGENMLKIREKCIKHRKRGNM
jgi:hypothetical protein